MPATAGPLGVLALVGRQPLAEEALHGQPLWLHALRGLAASVSEPPLVVSADADGRRGGAPRGDQPRARWTGARAWWDEVAARPRPLLVHDPLCPLTSATFLRQVAAIGADAEAGGGTAVAAYRPVTDTVKDVAGGRIVGTVDRELLTALSSPVYVGLGVVRAALAAGEVPPLADPAALVAWLRARGPVALVRAPSLARRVDDASAVALLECVDELEHRLRH